MLARVGVFSEKETSAQKLDTIYPYHRRELGIGWRRNSTKYWLQPLRLPNVVAFRDLQDRFFWVRAIARQLRLSRTWQYIWIPDTTLRRLHSWRKPSSLAGVFAAWEWRFAVLLTLHPTRARSGRRWATSVTSTTPMTGWEHGEPTTLVLGKVFHG